MHPWLLHSGHLLVPTFGFLVALGLMAALTLSLHTARAAGLNPERVWNAGLFTILSAFVLSRLLLIASNLRSFLAYPVLLMMVPSLTAAGVLLTIVATLVYLRTRSLAVLPTLDAWAPCATLAWAFLSLGHFAEGSDAGLPTGLPWGLAIPPSHIPLHPVALYAAVAALLLSMVLTYSLRLRRQAGDTAVAGLVGAGLIQFLLSFFRQPWPWRVETFTQLLDPIQWIALAMILTATLLFLQPRKLVSHAV